MITVALWFQDETTSLNVCLAAIHMFSLFYYLLLPHLPTYTLIQFLFTCTLSSFMMTWINRQTIVSQPVILIDRWVGIKNISTSHTLLLSPLTIFYVAPSRKTSKNSPGLDIVEVKLLLLLLLPFKTPNLHLKFYSLQIRASYFT